MTTTDPRPGDLSLFLDRLRTFIRRPAVTCSVTASGVEIARLLSREGVGSVIVMDGHNAPVGIVTDRDLRRNIVAAGRDPASTPASAVMSSPLIALRPDAFALEAVLEMTRRHIRHIPVVDNGRVLGVISNRDFLALQTNHPVTLVHEIAEAPSVADLGELAQRVTTLVRGLVLAGVSAYDIGQLVAELNDRVVARLCELTEKTLHDSGEVRPPVDYCWIALGSEGRREQTLRTDQDNGLVYADPPPELRERAAAYYARFADEAIRSLVSVGFPPCDGGFLASNPKWCQPLAVWKASFGEWMREPKPEAVLAASLCFDLRPIAGEVALGQSLVELFQAEAPGHALFLRMMAHFVVVRRLPLTWLGKIAVQKSGPHQGAVDVKGSGMIQLVTAARVDALRLAVAETNTVDRFRALAAKGAYSEQEAHEITDAYQHLMRLRLVHQLRQLAQGQPPDNYVNPDRLSRADSLLFRDALRIVGHIQEVMRQRFLTDLLG